MARALLLGALAAVTLAAPAPARSQQSTDSISARAMDGRLRLEIALLSRLLAADVPRADNFTVGNHEIAAGTVATGTVAVARGDIAVHGRIDGDALVLHGDIIVHPGGSISGNAISVDGGVRTAGGIIEGDIRTIRGITGSLFARTGGSAAQADPVTTWGALKMVIGWFAVLCAMGIGVLLFAEKNLDGVVLTLEQQFGRAFWMGALAQLAAVPALLLLVVGLAITLLGILLIPFAIVAYVIALTGLLTLGFLAAARFTGRAFARGTGESRAISLRSLLAGLILYLGLWMLAAAFVSSPVLGSVMRAVALAGSWVAVTLGLGATIISRAGTRRASAPSARAAPVSDMAWQTPTPVTGVVAARRPVPAKEGA
ncbi:MAG: hypothetical protein WD801_14435 [Gemmatimonadaceae bacterium]